VTGLGTNPLEKKIDRSETDLTLEGGPLMSIDEKVIEIIVEQLDVTREECVPEASFIEDLGADSLDLVELIMAMEETFDIQIADNELQQIRSIKNVLDYLRDKGVTWHE
jgi:acyl carrier protein